MTSDKAALGISLTYDHPVAPRSVRSMRLAQTPVAASGKAEIGFVGVGNYASRMLIPAFKAAGATLHSITSAGGTNAVVHGRRTGFSQATSDTDGLIANPEINAVAIVTHHNSHARLTAQALRAGKHVFVEKPLALTHDELEEVKGLMPKAAGA